MTSDGEAVRTPGWTGGLPIGWRGALVLFLVIVASIFALYWYLLRSDFVPVWQRLTANDARAVVAELTERDIPHQLAENGTTVLVPREMADRVRLDIAASELPLRGQIGFEIFNEADMGLTEFAQRINYQRALQGELTRTILLLEGIDNARVHLAIPDRSLFRRERRTATAAVTLIMTPGASITAERVAGIQRLVAGAVPEMEMNAVTILDDSGKTLSRPIEDERAIAGTEADATVQFMRARVSAAIDAVQGGLDYRVVVRMRQHALVLLPSSTTIRIDESPPDLPDPGRRNYAWDVNIITPQMLEPDLQRRISDAIVSTLAMSDDHGDRLTFSDNPHFGQTAGENPLEVVSRTPPVADTDNNVLAAEWVAACAFVLGALVTSLILAAMKLFRRMRKRRGEQAISSFADQLRARLAEVSASE